MKIAIYILALFLFCNGCVQDTRSYESKQKDQQINLFSKKMKPYGLRAVGFGGASRDGKATLFSVTFMTDEVLEKNAGRRLIITCVNEFLNHLNSVEENYYFVKIPADLSMIDVGIIGSAPEAGGDYLFSVSFRNDTIYYNYDNQAVRVKNFPSEKESFEEALRIIEAERTLSQVIASPLKHLI